MTGEQRSKRIHDVVIQLNKLAQERKDKLDRVWLKIKKSKEPDDEILVCLDQLWELENKTEPLRLELVDLVKGEDGSAK